MSKRLTVIKPKPSSALEELVSDYLAHAKASGQSPKSTDLASTVLERVFLPWCAEHDIAGSGQLTQRVLDNWTAYLLHERRTPKGQPMARESVRTYARYVRIFLKFAELDRVKVQQPKAEQRIVQTLTREQIQGMEDTATAERDKLVIRLLADSGLRLGELLGLRVDDLEEKGRERYIRVRGKGARERMVPVAPALFARLRRYAQHGRRDATTQRIFITNRRSQRTGEYEPLASRSLQNVLEFVGKAAGIMQKVHPHLFRHSFATWALQRNMNPLQLQRILGHADLTMITSTYAHLQPSDAYEAMLALVRADD